MTSDLVKSSKHVLEPYDRVSEILFGLIMVLTFTGSLSVANAARDDVRTMLVGALGCNLAWGMIDGVFFLMGCLADKGKGLQALRSLRQTTDPQKARQILCDALPSVVASVLEPAEVNVISKRLRELPEPPKHARLRKDDWVGGLGVFFMVFLSTFPVVIPFLVMTNLLPAMRVSNAIAMGMLFLTGCAFGRITGRRPWMMGVMMVLLGGVLVGITIALGG